MLMEKLKKINRNGNDSSESNACFGYLHKGQWKQDLEPGKQLQNIVMNMALQRVLTHHSVYVHQTVLLPSSVWRAAQRRGG